MPKQQGPGGFSIRGSVVTCPSCERCQLVEIEIKVGEEPVQMRSCSRCDHRWWVRQGQLVSVGGLLDLVRR